MFSFFIPFLPSHIFVNLQSLHHEDETQFTPSHVIHSSTLVIRLSNYPDTRQENQALACEPVKLLVTTSALALRICQAETSSLPLETLKLLVGPSSLALKPLHPVAQTSAYPSELLTTRVSLFNLFVLPFPLYHTSDRKKVGDSPSPS